MIVGDLLTVNNSPGEKTPDMRIWKISSQYSDTCQTRYLVLMSRHTEYDDATLVFDVLLPEAMKCRVSRSQSWITFVNSKGHDETHIFDCRSADVYRRCNTNRRSEKVWWW